MQPVVASASSGLNDGITRGLQDKMYDKRKTAALAVEKLVREAQANRDDTRIRSIIQALVNEFTYNFQQPNARNGGLIGLAAAAIALGQDVVGHLNDIVPPVLACFNDQDSRVRYYACESMYNIAKVARGDILRYFNDLFDALSKLAADSELSVKSGAELLDRLLKDIVSEQSTYVIGSTHIQESLNSNLGAVIQNVSSFGDPLDVTAVPPAMPRTFSFSLARFIPLLRERIQTLNPFTRTFLVLWIGVLDSIPDLELIAYLPEFLDGLFSYLSDPNPDVRTLTLNVLGEFLKEIKRVEDLHKRKLKLKTLKSGKGKQTRGYSHKTSKNALETDFGKQKPTESKTKSNSGSDLRRESDGQFVDILQQQEGFVETDPDLDVEEPEGEHEDSDGSFGSKAYEPGEGVMLQYPRMTEILCPHLSSSDEQMQQTAMHWINEFISLSGKPMVPFVPVLVGSVLPCLAHANSSISVVAQATNTNLFNLVSSLDLAGESQKKDGSNTDSIDYRAIMQILTAQLTNSHEETRIAAVKWMAMLHKKAPQGVISATPEIPLTLLNMLSDASEEVVKRDLQLLAQIAEQAPSDEYFVRFIRHLLNLFMTDRRLLETRGSLIVRQLCLSLDPERMYRCMAEILERDEDLDFASTMVQNLNIILVTAPELADLRRRLKSLDSLRSLDVSPKGIMTQKSGNNGPALFVALYKSWCHNPVATFALCLLAQAYEHASNLLATFADLEITVNLLIQVDKLVQLLESPVFTYLRMQLLEPDQYPFLFKCLYGILMLLPQSSAFATLRNRLNSVGSMVMLSTHNRTVASDDYPPSRMQSGAGATNSQFLRSRSDMMNPISLSERTSSLPSGPNTETFVSWQDLLQHFRHVQGKHEKARSLALRGTQSRRRGMTSRK
ncbi:ARM repeat-containing protein [Gonapodya prolifera JEL478]|uniref:ARM repeat-containing protein n=1 Tax=Gonapodya prolifera (strain JEL478) TaxID=1344416 RepID=A0A139AZ13_GONPJ|nr:ARM repeat-containing protein [Gonapodya prolifera JEL478]|eukprot:KXS21992.1 ARM repeat-containing protein [Gonapodya prolifera JEL478]